MHGDFLHEDYRTGGPNLVALPSEYVPLPRDPPKGAFKCGSPLARSIWTVLTDYKVDVRKIVLAGRRTSRWDQRDTAEVFPTLLVHARKHDIWSRAWLDACIKNP